MLLWSGFAFAVSAPYEVAPRPSGLCIALDQLRHTCASQTEQCKTLDAYAQGYFAPIQNYCNSKFLRPSERAPDPRGLVNVSPPWCGCLQSLALPCIGQIPSLSRWQVSATALKTKNCSRTSRSRPCIEWRKVSRFSRCNHLKPFRADHPQLPKSSLRDILAPLGNCARGNAKQLGKCGCTASQGDCGLCFHGPKCSTLSLINQVFLTLCSSMVF